MVLHTKLYACVSLFAMTASGWAAVTDIQSFSPTTFAVGESLGDANRTMVYVIDRTGFTLRAIDTSTGRQVQKVALAGSPLIAPPVANGSARTGQMAINPAGTQLWVALTTAKKIQCFSLPDLTPVSTFALGFEPGGMAVAADGTVLVSPAHSASSGVIHAINPNTGLDVATLSKGGANWYDLTQIRTNAAGTRLYAVESGLSSSTNPIYEFNLTTVGFPQITTYTVPCSNLRDLAIDEVNRRFYTSQGGIYGVQATTMSPVTQAYWPFSNSYYGTGVALLQGSGPLYSVSSTRLNAFDRLNGGKLGDCTAPAGTAGSIVPRSLAISAQDKLTYILENWRGDGGGYDGSNWFMVLVGGSRLTFNQAPITTNALVTTAEDTSVPVTLGAADAENDQLTFRLTTLPRYGSLVGNGTLRTYVPAVNFFGTDSFQFISADANGDGTTATVTIMVTPINDLPIVQDVSVAIDEDTNASGNFVGVDVEGDPLSFTLVSAPAHGSAVVSPTGLWTYVPQANYHGSDEFTATAADQGGAGVIGHVRLDIRSVNDAPISSNQIFSCLEDTAINGTLACSDVDGDVLIVSVVGTPAHGTVVFQADGRFTYQPAQNWNGTDRFTFNITDGTIAVGPFEALIQVNPVNDPPVASALNLTTPVNTSTIGSLTATDADGDACSFRLATKPNLGTATILGNQLTYTPFANAIGTDSFIAQAVDTAGAVGEAQVTIQITGSGLPVPWALSTVGTVTPAPTTIYDWTNRRFTIAGAGANMTTKADACAFLNQGIDGDVTIIVKVASQTNTATGARAGILFRDSSTVAGSREAGVLVSPSNGLSFVRRTTLNGSLSTTSQAAPNPARRWLRLQRVGNVITASSSVDGIIWITGGTATVTLNTRIQAGLGVTSGKVGTASTAVFESVQVILPAPPAGNG